ncbi:MAG: DUF4153 domain-containing protein [Alphaproteobacteria bacterium]|nr:DUF4153 domain-containing protein [Alphaproteobacteria bacterium]
MTTTATSTTPEKETLAPWVGWARLAIGLAQGFALYLVTYHQGAFGEALQAALLTAVVFVPVLVIGGLGAFRWTTLGLWSLVATLMAAGLSWYEVSRLDGEQGSLGRPQAIFFVVPVLLFVGHHLVQAADEARRWFAPYERYFDLGWRHGAQLLLAILFTGAFWAVLVLGSALFNLIGITFLMKLIQNTWFAMPATCGVFAAAIHLTDLRSGLVRGARALGLVLLSWLLPAMAGLAAAFFVALPFTGLEPLWATRAATTILLSAAGVLVVLVNAAYQDGVHTPGAILRWSARVASVLMTPLAALAAYALYLRIAQYGLTPDRIYALAVLTIGICYAISYAIGAFSPRWMKPLEAGNIASAIAVILVSLALFSPIADPARLSVSDQMRRFRAGITPVDQLDLSFLRFEGASYGRAALQSLAQDRSTDEARTLSDRVATVLAAHSPYELGPQMNGQPVQAALIMRPETATLPEDLTAFLNQVAVSMCVEERPCSVLLRDLNGDGVDEALVGTASVLWVYARNANGWVQIGSVNFRGAPPHVEEA